MEDNIKFSELYLWYVLVIVLSLPSGRASPGKEQLYRLCVGFHAVQVGNHHVPVRHQILQVPPTGHSQ